MQEHASSEPTNTDVDETARTEEDVGRLLYAIANADQKSWPYRHFAVRDVIDSAWAKELASMDLGERMVRIAEQRRIRVDPNRFTLTLMPGDIIDLIQTSGHTTDFVQIIADNTQRILQHDGAPGSPAGDYRSTKRKQQSHSNENRRP